MVEQEQWNDEKDLIALSGRYENVDHLTRWLFRVAIPWFDRLIGERIKVKLPVLLTRRRAKGCLAR